MANAQAELTPATEHMNRAYLRGLQIDARRISERCAGRSGYLSAELEAESRNCDRVIGAALDAGYCFDRMAFGDVEAA